jgi:ADP-ribose pyrophosphatase YjhB (NUDIX family)
VADLTRTQQKQLTAAANRVRNWFDNRIDDQSLDIARLYSSERDRLVYRLRQVYDEYLGDSPTLTRARFGPAGPAIEHSIEDAVQSLANELGRKAVSHLTDTLNIQPAIIERHLGQYVDLPFRQLPQSTQDVLRDLTTDVVGGGTFFDRMMHQTSDFRNDLYSTVRQSLLNGEDFDALRTKVHKAFGVDKLKEPSGPAYGSVKTYRNEALRQWNELMGEMAGTAGGMEVWFASLDERSTPGCVANHGIRIDEIGDRPPRHYNCRCNVLILEPGTDLTPYLVEADVWLKAHGWTREQAALEEADFDPQAHPRDEEGKFAEKPDGEAAEQPWEKSGKDLGSVYHGGAEKVRRIDPERIQSRDYGYYGSGFYVTDIDKKAARSYGGVVTKGRIAADAKVLDLSAASKVVGGGLRPQEVHPKLVDRVYKHLYDKGIERARSRGKEKDFLNELSRVREHPLDWKDAVNRFAIDNKYDVIKYSPGEIVIKRPDAFVFEETGWSWRGTLTEADFDPQAHPRDEGGQFTDKPEGGRKPAAFGQMHYDQFPEKSGPPGEHLYHTTSRDNLDDIAANGLEPHGPDFRGEQDAWPDGGDEKRVYFASRPGGALSFSERDHVLLRVKSEPVKAKGLKAEFPDSDYYTRKKVAPEHIEVLQDDGSWAPLKGKRQEAGWNWGKERLLPLYQTQREAGVEFASVPWRQVPAVTVGRLRPKPATYEATLAAGGPDHVLLRKRHGAWEARTARGWAALRDRFPGGRWVTVEAGLALDSPGAPAWNTARKRLDGELLARWPALRAVSFPVVRPGGLGLYAARIGGPDEAFAWTLRPALFRSTAGQGVAVSQDLSRAITQAAQASDHLLPSDPYLGVAVGQEPVSTVVSMSTGRVIYSREPALDVGYQRAAVVLPEGEGVWAVRTRDHDFWELPGGRVNPGEVPAEAGAREMEEETGIRVRILHSLGLTHQPWATTEVFLAERIGDGEQSTPGEINAVGCVPIQNLTANERLFLNNRLSASTSCEVIA